MVALASEISIGIMNNDFRISAGIISFAIFLFYYKDLNPITTGILSGTMMFILRLGVYYLTNGNVDNIIISYLLEIIFYISYSLIYSFLMNRKNKEDMDFVFGTLIISDFSANLIEMILRLSIERFEITSRILAILLLVSIVRSTIAWLVLNGLRYYRLLLLKQEHENRYKKLLWLTSKLTTEMYWIEKNMENIEKVMSESYQLFEKINLNENSEEWGGMALNIARDVHEIKKENGLVVRGIQDITEKELKDKSMDFKDLMNILYETMHREIRLLGKDIKLRIHIGESFYTSKHYYLMSMFRNLAMNSIDAMGSLEKQGEFNITHMSDNKTHYFTVSDNGTGIDEESLNNIFSPGYSTKINYNTGEINRGLGLSIVKYIVEEQLGGSLRINSKIGEGTSFHIKILKVKLEES